MQSLIVSMSSGYLRTRPPKGVGAAPSMRKSVLHEGAADGTAIAREVLAAQPQLAPSEPMRGPSDPEVPVVHSGVQMQFSSQALALAEQDANE